MFAKDTWPALTARRGLTTVVAEIMGAAEFAMGPHFGVHAHNTGVAFRTCIQKPPMNASKTWHALFTSCSKDFVQAVVVGCTIAALQYNTFVQAKIVWLA